MSGRLVIMGSGETSPTMIKLHRELVSASGSGPCAMLDTSFGFQANADDLTEKITGYFAESVGTSLEPARWRRRDEPVADRERTLALLRRAAFVFAGPGSPSYALRQWIDTPVPETLVGVVTRGGTAVLGSAAAATVGSHTLPVYEIYKVGEDPYWLDGLDLLGQLTGLQAAVVPHFDNREGGRHDTSFCYVGEQRFRVLEAQLPSTVGVLGVDEHTAVVIDVGAQTVSVHGAGMLTLRHGSVNQTFASGALLALSEAAAVLTGAPAERPSITVSAAAEAPETAVATSLAESAEVLAARFDECLAAGDAHGALAAALDLEESIHAWSADTLQGDDMRIARQHLRSMLVALAGSAERGLGDPRAVVAPVVDVILDVRRRAREAKDFATSDVIRDGLAAAGIEVRDTAEGVTWELTGE